MNIEIVNSIDKIKTSKRELTLQIFVVFILPIFLINFGLLALKYRSAMLISLVTILVAIVITEKWTPSMLGFDLHRIKKYILPYMVFTILGILVATTFGEQMGREELDKWWQYNHFIYGFFIVSLFQEIAYRGYLVPALGKLISRPIYILIANAILFTFLHSIFPNPIIGLPLAMIGGLGFAYMYMKYPSLILITLSHALINFFVVLYGFFAIPGVTY